MQFKELNESGYLNWLNPGESTLQFHYMSNFYGTCKVQVSVLHNGHQVVLQEETFSVVELDVRRGTAIALEKAARSFLNRILLVNLRDLNGLSQSPSSLPKQFKDQDESESRPSRLKFLTESL